MIVNILFHNYPQWRSKLMVCGIVLMMHVLSSAQNGDHSIRPEIVSTFTGKDYCPSYIAYEGGPFIDVEDEANLSNDYLVYGGGHYRNVVFNYDVYKQIIVYKLRTENGYNFVQLNNNRVDSFSISGRIFYATRFFPSLSQSGFFENLYASTDLSIIVIRSKEIKGKVSGTSYHSRLVSNDKYYLIYKGESYVISSLSDFEKIFPSMSVQLEALKVKSNENADNDFFEQQLIRIGKIIVEYTSSRTSP